MSDRPATVIDPITGTLVRRYVPWATHQHQVGGSLVEYPSDCVVQVGTRESGGTEEGERITVDCANLRGSSRFGVVLDAGGPAGQWISALYRDGLRGRPWERSASQISMINGDYSMRFHRHAIFEVFGGAHETWWSSIIVVPYFPDIWSPEQVDNPQVCFFRDAAFSVSQFCLRAGGAERALVGLHNDSISSISGDPSLRYQICVDSGFQGACQILSGFYDEELLHEYGMQDTISSVRVCSKEPRRMTQGAPDNRGFMGDVLAQYNPEVNAIQFFRLRLPGSYPPPPLRSGFNAAWLSLPNYDECG